MEMSDLPKFEPLPNVGNVVSNRVTAFNQGYNLYQCINYLQGYVSIVYENMDALLDDWNNFQQVVNDNIKNMATEETQKILNQWLEDGTLNDLIAQNPLWNQKLDKSGGTMTGNIKFSENTKIVGTTPGGNDIDLIHNTNDGATGNYVKFGDPDAKTVINSNQQPVWHNGDDDYLLLTQKQLDDGLAGKVNKSGDTMTGTLNVTNIMNDGRNVIKGGTTNITLSDTRIHTAINSMDKPTFFYSGRNNIALDDTDIINNLTSTSTTKVLSANQGKILYNLINEINNKLFRLVKIYNNTEVIHFEGKNGFFDFLSKQNVIDKMGITEEQFNINRILFMAWNTDLNSNSFYITSTMIGPVDNILKFRYENGAGAATAGRVTYVLMLFSDTDDHE